MQGEGVRSAAVGFLAGAFPSDGLASFLGAVARDRQRMRRRLGRIASPDWRHKLTKFDKTFRMTVR